MKDIRKKYFLLFIVFNCFYLQAQVSTKVFTEDLNKWYEMEQVNITKDSKWFVFKKSTQKDSLIVFNTQDNTIRSFENSNVFDLDRSSGKILFKNTTGWVYGDLNKDFWSKLPWKENYYFNDYGSDLFWDNNNQIGSFSISRQKEILLDDIDTAIVKNTGRAVVYFKENKGLYYLYWLDKKTLKQSLVTIVETKPYNFVFEANKDVFVFGREISKGEHQLFVAKKTMNKWEITNQKGSYHWSGSSYLLDAEKSTVFYETLDSVYIKPKAGAVEVRNSLSDYKEAKELNQVVWNYKDNKETLLFGSKDIQVFNTAVPNVFLGFDATRYDLRDFRSVDRADLVILSDGNRQKLIEKEVLILTGHVLVHTHLPYIVYYKSGFWWSYHLKTEKKICLNPNMPYGFENLDKNYASSTEHYGAFGWGFGESILLYDQFDIWKCNLDGTGLQRITKGRGEQLTYRNAEESLYKVDFLRNLSLWLPIIEHENDLICSVYNSNSEKTGIQRITNLKKINTLLPLERYKYQWVKRVGNGDILLKRSNHSVPVQFLLTDDKGGVKWKYQSNSNSSLDSIKPARLFTITCNDGYQSKASLFYPSVYDPNKKYPMVVYYYEKTASELNDFVAPSLYNQNGFNRSLLNNNGYFVLNVDMRYQYNEVTKYLVDDTNTILDKVIAEEKSIAADRIGIFGFSFGGYEVMYIVGQSNRFQAAVAGAGVFDLTDFYYGEKENGSLGMETVENLQFRTVAPYLNPNFDKLNPVRYVDRTTTPILLWSGDDDYRISKHHSVKMYLALKKQKKAAELLLYKGEYHNILKPENQKDLTLRTLDFFDRKLK